MSNQSSCILFALPHLNCYRMAGVASSEMLPTAPRGTIELPVKGRQRNGNQNDA
jgi:hypothetical protein